MDNLLTRLKTIMDKANGLKSSLEKAGKERDRYQSRIADLEKELSEKDKEMEQIRDQYEAAKAVRSVGLNGNQDLIRNKIDAYLKEIDLCLKNFGE